MKPILILLCLMLPWSSQAAEKRTSWTRVAQLESGAVQYVDLGSIRKERGWLKVRTLVDHRTPVSWARSKQVRSEIDNQYVDCANHKFQVIESSAFTCAMGRCRAVEQFRVKSQTIDFKRMTESDSPLDFAYRMACRSAPWNRSPRAAPSRETTPSSLSGISPTRISTPAAEPAR